MHIKNSTVAAIPTATANEGGNFSCATERLEIANGVRS